MRCSEKDRSCPLWVTSEHSPAHSGSSAPPASTRGPGSPILENPYLFSRNQIHLVLTLAQLGLGLLLDDTWIVALSAVFAGRRPASYANTMTTKQPNNTSCTRPSRALVDPSASVMLATSSEMIISVP